MSDEPVLGPFPYFDDWNAAREAAGHEPIDAQVAVGSPWLYLAREDLSAAFHHREEWRKWKERRLKAERAAERAALPHPNWQSRTYRCVVGVPVKPTLKHAAWERAVERCGGRVVAFDGTDTRATGFLYGACARHLSQAVADDPERRWLWADGRPLDRADVEGELTLLVLAGAA